MRRLMSFGAVLLCLHVPSARAQSSADKQLVATIAGQALAGGLVSGLAWDGGTLIIQTVAVQRDGTRASGYLTVAGPRMELRSLTGPPPEAERYWATKASRVSPTGLGTITLKSDTKLPMYGVASQERRFLDSMDMGGTQGTHELFLGDLLLHRRRNAAPPYDGEVWSWSPAELNRIAYVDENGDLWIARADGTGAERVLKGKFSVPAWSSDGLIVAVAERKNDAKWEVSVVHLPERYRQQ